ncbi:MAG: NifB/NifX family molybdenum-iron cluster-binding protein [Candidatus Thorarchaeota archaeon]
MTTRIIIPTQDMNGNEIADHFGRAPYFAVAELDENGTVVDLKVHPNTGEHSGGKGHAHDNVLRYNPEAIIVKGMGPRGIQSFQSKNIAVLRANSFFVQELIQAFNQNTLQELTEGCADAHHK